MTSKKRQALEARLVEIKKRRRVVLLTITTYKGEADRLSKEGARIEARLGKGEKTQ